MAHLDVYRNPDSATSRVVPYVVDVQSDLLGDLPTHMVIPLARPAAIETLPILHLNPLVNIRGTELVVMTQDMAAVPRRMLKQSVSNLSSRRGDVLAALDFLFTGF